MTGEDAVPIPVVTRRIETREELRAVPAEHPRGVIFTGGTAPGVWENEVSDEEIARRVADMERGEYLTHDEFWSSVRAELAAHTPTPEDG